MKALTALLIIMSYGLQAEEAPIPPKSPTPVVPSTKTPAKVAAKDVKYKKNVSLEFEGRNVDGNVVSPDNADVEGDKNIKFAPLLEGRKDFKREFKRSSGVSR